MNLWRLLLWDYSEIVYICKYEEEPNINIGLRVKYLRLLIVVKS